VVLLSTVLGEIFIKHAPRISRNNKFHPVGGLSFSSIPAVFSQHLYPFLVRPIPMQISRPLNQKATRNSLPFYLQLRLLHCEASTAKWRMPLLSELPKADCCVNTTSRLHFRLCCTSSTPASGALSERLIRERNFVYTPKISHVSFVIIITTCHTNESGSLQYTMVFITHVEYVFVM